MDPTLLALATCNLLQPALAAHPGQPAETIGAQLPALAGRVWDELWKRLASKQQGKAAAQAWLRAPVDFDAQVYFRQQVEKLLEEDAVFAVEIQRLVARGARETHTGH